MLYVVLGICSGILSGFMGIGGGIILIPSLVYLFGFTQHEAQGTTLALMVPPIGILAAWKYFQEGHVDLHAALWIALGFLLGSFVGATISNGLSNRALSLIFGFLLLAIGTHIIWKNV